ncbi:hypothetical protein HMPREF3034_01461 [Prevotella sp. DNF00663]|nr:hypothetical protein HMPREF3034_01461 [Prevotella sp. DNF00663]
MLVGCCIRFVYSIEIVCLCEIFKIIRRRITGISWYRNIIFIDNVLVNVLYLVRAHTIKCKGTNKVIQKQSLFVRSKVAKRLILQSLVAYLFL